LDAHGAASRGGAAVARITVVDDNPEFLETMFSILDGLEGHDVAGFDGNQTSIEQLVASDPELLIVDLRMAGDDMRGWDILMLARAEESLRRVPLIVCSGDITTLRARADEFARLGNVHTLEKPFGLDDVTSLVERVLGEQPPASEQAS
jgi:DNA-binding NtrC family response regulator